MSKAVKYARARYLKCYLNYVITSGVILLHETHSTLRIHTDIVSALCVHYLPDYL